MAGKPRGPRDDDSTDESSSASAEAPANQENADTGGAAPEPGAAPEAGSAREAGPAAVPGEAAQDSADDAAGANGTASAPPDQGRRITLQSNEVKKLVGDALALANYAIESGAKTATGDPLPFDDIGIIQRTAVQIGALDPTAPAGSEPPPPSITPAEWNSFCLAYYRLAAVMSPVTAETLRDTEGTSRSLEAVDPSEKTYWRRLRKVRDALFGFSPALRFTRGLWLVAIAIAVFVVVSEWWIYSLGLEPNVQRDLKFLFMKTTFGEAKQLLDSLVPWAYGALGACAYLLRSAHTYIYRRSFDLRRKPEYFNRILLGAISGGAIILYTKYLADDEGTVIQLGSAALGFIAGYSTDFLFNTIERIVQAIFPKVGMEPVPASDTKPRLADLPDHTNGDAAANDTRPRPTGERRAGNP